MLLIAAVALSSCAVSIQPVRPVVVSAAPANTVTIDRRLKIPVYPGSQIVNLDGDDDDTKVTFSSTANLEQVNAYFHREILARGYSRTKYEIKNSNSRIEAEYRNNKQKLEYKLDKEGNSNRFKLELEFDD
jgi:hypothetical protein